jgi:hypothetical protein
VDSDCGPIGGHTLCGDGPRAGTTGINSWTRSEAHYCVSGVRLFFLILCKSGFHALLRCKQQRRNAEFVFLFSPP